MAKESKKTASGGFRWRRWLGGLLLAAVGVSTAMAALKVRDFALTDSQFTLSHDRPGALQIIGLTYASRQKVTRIFAADFDRSIFAIPLEERRRHGPAIRAPC